MKHKYKIQKIQYGDGSISYDVKYKKVGFLSCVRNILETGQWWRDSTSHNTLKEAQDQITREIKLDSNDEQVVVKTYKYKVIPDYIPKEQEEKFMEKSNGE